MSNNNRFKVLIVDDEAEARLLLRSLLGEIRNVEVVGEASQAEEALYCLVEHFPDLIFMDINMPGKTGMDLIHLIKKRNVDIPVVFISAFKEYAIQAIRNGVYDYLLKPVSRTELEHVIEKYRRRNERDLPRRLIEMLENIKEDTKIRINSRHSYILINPSDIVFCQTEDGYTVIYLSNGKEEVASGPLAQIESMVENWNFYRLGRSVLINQDYIRSVDKTSDKCVLQSSSHSWEIKASHKAITELLSISFNYA